MKYTCKLSLILLLLFTILVSAGCSETSNEIQSSGASQSATLAPTPTTIPTPTTTPNKDIYANAFQNYTSSAKIAAVYNTENKVFYYENQDVETRIYPASTTKLFTAYVALQIFSPDEIVIVGDELNFVAEDASVASLQEGNTLTVQKLIEGMMLPSGNDAAYTIACNAGRRIAKNKNLSSEIALEFFMQEMNQQALRLGLNGSHFTCPDGYHNEAHYTTIKDLMEIATLALSNETIAHSVRIAEETVSLAPGVQVTWKNTNWLVRPDSPYYTPDAIGLKTGHTDAAGYVLLSAFPGRSSSSYIIILVAQCDNLESRFQYTKELYQVLKDISEA